MSYKAMALLPKGPSYPEAGRWRSWKLHWSGAISDRANARALAITKNAATAPEKRAEGNVSRQRQRQLGHAKEAEALTAK